MRYTVVWTSSADQELARLWLEAGMRQAVADATNQVERALASNPHRIGFEVDDDYREVLVPPLSFLYRVRDGDRIVTVIYVRQLRDDPL